MNYIIFDLEWNNAYNYKLKRGMNEIIEIGAVKLNDKLNVVDTYKRLIKPQISKKLGSRFKNLTHITIDEINENGISFENAFDEFSAWCGSGDKVFLSWSTSDLYTLVNNFRYFEGITNIGFMTKYCDAQKYCMSFIPDSSSANQISLANCAQVFGITVDTESLHRALEDCMITAYCFKKVYDSEKFKNYVKTCDASFFERLLYKPSFIKQEECDDFSLSSINFKCPECSGEVIPIIKFKFEGNSFKGAGACNKCENKFWLYVRAKRNYDNVKVSIRCVKINKQRAKSIN